MYERKSRRINSTSPYAAIPPPKTGSLFFVAVENVVGNHRVRRRLGDQLHAVGEPAGAVGAEEVHLLAGEVVSLEEREQRHRHTYHQLGYPKNTVSY